MISYFGIRRNSSQRRTFLLIWRLLQRGKVLFLRFIVVGITVVVVGAESLVFLSGLDFAAIAFFSEGEV